MGCGSSQSTNVIRSGKVAPLPMEVAPSAQQQQVTPAAKPAASASTVTTGQSSSSQQQTKQLFQQPVSQATVPPAAAAAAPPSPAPSRKSTKSLSSRSHAGVAAAAKKHGGSNRSLASLRADEKRKRDQVTAGGSTSSLSRRNGEGERRQSITSSATTASKQGTSGDLPQTQSKVSMRTADSGLGGDDDHAVHVTGSGVKVLRIVDDGGDQEESQAGNTDENRPPTPDLSISGKAIQSRKPGSAARRRNEMSSLEAPDKDTSIIQRPPSRGGMAFDIVVASPDTGNVRRPPSRLRQLDRRPSTDRLESSEQLKKKLAAAEKRRQQYEKENVLSKVEAQRQRSSQVQSALQAFAARQTQQTEGKIVQHQDKQAENREARIGALRERLKAREEHAHKVREAKAALATTTSTD